MSAALAFFEPLSPWPFGDLAARSFDLIVVDPPWRFQTYSEDGGPKSVAAQYACLDTEEIAARFPVGDLARRDCLLLCWATAPLLGRQIACVESWGFEYKSALVWRKTTASGAQAWGLGHRVRSMAELVLVATKGEPKHRPFRGVIDGVRREHSRKPVEFYAEVDRCCCGLTRRADLFTRETRPGWVGWGDQATKFDEVAA